MDVKGCPSLFDFVQLLDSLFRCSVGQIALSTITITITKNITKKTPVSQRNFALYSKALYGKHTFPTVVTKPPEITEN